MKKVVTVTSQPEYNAPFFARTALHGRPGDAGERKKTRTRIARLTMAAMFLTASPAVQAQQVAGVAGGTPTPANTVQPAVPKKTIAEKAAIAAAILAAGVAAFKTIKATAQPSVNAEPPVPSQQAIAK